MSNGRKRFSLARRILLWGMAVVVILVAFAVVLLRTQYHGEKLADFVEKQLNDTIRGDVEIGSIEWEIEDLPTVVSGGWVPITVYDFKLYDDYKLEVVNIPVLKGEIDAHAAMFGNHDLMLRNIRAPHGGEATIRMVEEPYPIHEYDETAVSILTAFYSEKKPAVYAGLTAAPRPIVEFRDFKLTDIDLTLQFDYFDGLLEDVNAKGFVVADDTDPLSRKLYYSVTGDAPKGHLSIYSLDGEKVPLTDIDIEQLEQLPKQWPRDPYANDVEWFATATSQGGARIELSGAMLDYWQDYFGGDYEALLALRDGGELARDLSDGMVSGEKLETDVFVDGPVLAPRFTVAMREANIAIDITEDEEPLDLQLHSAAAQFDLATEEGYLENTILEGAGGEVQVQSTFALEPLQVDININIPKAIEMRPYLPPDVANLAGTKLRGRLHAFGTRENQRIDDLHLWLGRAHLQGELFREQGQIIHTERLRISMGDTLIGVSEGWVDFAEETLYLPLSFTSGDAGRYLRYFGAPALAKRVAGNGRVSGSFVDPEAWANVQATGVPVVERVDARLDYRRQILDVKKISSNQLGGSLSGRGRIQLGKTTRILGFRADARGLDLSRAPGAGGLLAGSLSGSVEARGPVSRLDASARARVDGLEVAGDPFEAFAIAMESSADGTRSVEVEARRTRGGTLDGAATLGRAGELGGAVTLRDLPIETLAFLAPRPGMSPVGGRLEADFALNGNLDAPTADGNISLVRAWFGQAFLGTADLEVERTGEGMIAIRGHMFQGKLAVDATMETRAPYRTTLDLRARRVEIDQFVPSLVEEYGVRGWFSGDIQLEMALLSNERPRAKLRLTELTLLRDNVDPRGRPAPIRISNRTPLVIAFDGERATFEESAVFEGPAGDFTVSGSGTEDELALKLDGEVAVQLLQPYLREYFAEMGGALAVSVAVTGSVEEPQVTGTVQFDDVRVRPTGQDATVTVPRGKVTVTPTQVAITDFTVRMVDKESDERAELIVRGGIGMSDFTPTVWALQAEGQLAGKMLLVAAPQAFSSASGMAYVNLWLRGPGEAPDDIDGTLWFACPEKGSQNAEEAEDYALVGDRCKIDRPLTFNARGMRKELSFTDGKVTVDEDTTLLGSHVVLLRDIGGWIDNEGRLQGVSGEITLDAWEPTELDIRGSATALPLRVPRTLDITVDLASFRVVGGLSSGIGIEADVEIIDGRYVRDFNLVTGFLKQERTTEVSEPFYEEIPLLATARLDISVETRAFFVQNNVATVQLSGDLDITGTPADPRLDGVINVDQGTFKFQGMRARFTRTSGSVTFSRRQPFPEETPIMDLQSEADFRDSSGQEHVITLIIRGTLENFTYDLFTDTGLNKGQTLMLISSGRTTEDFRQQLGDEAIGNDPTRIQAGDTGAGNVYDELLKDLAGDFISILIEDKLRAITKLDVFRVEIGTTSVGVHAEKEFTKNFRALGDLERTIRGWQWNVRGELRVSDRVSLEGEWVQRSQEDDAEQDRSAGRLKAVWRHGWQ